jgi:D-beta-D-heptose 7-phosphate kinase/D-beta-D-heptose 1-phosphate adenosyltransferase
MFDFDALAHAMTRQTVLCVGDLMLDEFVYGEVSRISPEAPAPVITVQRSETDVGGAGNVARNIASLGARCLFVGLTGDDDAGKTLRAELAGESLIESVLVCDPTRPTTRKVRFVAEHSSTHMLRADWELARPAATEVEQKLIDAVLPLLPCADIVLLSDYAKGVLTTRVIRNVIDAARKLGKRVIVDPKSANLAIYRGATLLKPNRKEFAEATRSRADTDRNIADAAQDACIWPIAKPMLVTQERARHDAGAARGERSMCRRFRSRCATSRAPATRSPRAGAGAGGRRRLGDALRMANAAAAVAGRQERHGRRDAGRAAAKNPAACLAAAEEKIVAGGGDLDSHLADGAAGPAHRLYQWLLRHPASRPRQGADGRARRLRRLIVGLNSDASVKRLKGEGRPVQDERARAEVLAALEAVDLVAIFEEDTPIDLITQVKPSVLVKGGDYTREQVVGHEIVEATGGEVVLSIFFRPQHNVAGRSRAGRQA